MSARITSSVPVDSSYHLAALQPPLVYDPLRHNTDVHPYHGDCCICHELGRYSTGKVGQSLPSTLSFRTQCCLGRVLIKSRAPAKSAVPGLALFKTVARFICQAACMLYEP